MARAPVCGVFYCHNLDGLFRHALLLVTGEFAVVVGLI